MSMTFVCYLGGKWKCKSTTKIYYNRPEIEDIPDKSSRSDQASIIKLFKQEKICLDAKQRKKLQIREARKKHKERLEKLAVPRRQIDIEASVKRATKPLEKLLPRIQDLAKPKFTTPKYVKPVEEPYSLPGAIEDWKAHDEWLLNRAKPRKRVKTPENEATSTSKITREGLQRIFLLAKPRCIYKCARSFRIKRSDKAWREVSEGRSLVSLPRIQEDGNPDNRLLSRALKPSNSAMTYEVYERIKSLENSRKRKFGKPARITFKRYLNCCRSISCENN